MAKTNITTQGTPVQGISSQGSIAQSLISSFGQNIISRSTPEQDPLDRFNTLDYALITKYVQNGLTVTSNDINIHPRDEGGNIILQENSTNNPLLIIEPTTTKIATKSLLRVLNTRFEYYKFPVSITPVVDNLDLELTIDIPETDPIFAIYSPSQINRLPGSDPPIASGIFLDNVVAGLPQTNPNSYTVNQATKDSGKDLRIRAKIRHSYVYPADNTNPGNVYFYVGRGGASGTDREFAGPFTSRTNGVIYDNETWIVDKDFTIRNSDFITGTTFNITAKTGQENAHIIQANGTYFSVTDATKNVDEFNEPL